MEGDVGTGVVGLDRSGDQAVERERLIEGAQHQRLEYIADETLRCRSGTQVVRIRGCGRSYLVGERQAASFRGLRVGVGRREKSAGSAGWPCMAIA